MMRKPPAGLSVYKVVLLTREEHTENTASFVCASENAQKCSIRVLQTDDNR